MECAVLPKDKSDVVSKKLSLTLDYAQKIMGLIEALEADQKEKSASRPSDSGLFVSFKDVENEALKRQIDLESIRDAFSNELESLWRAYEAFIKGGDLDENSPYKPFVKYLLEDRKKLESHAKGVTNQTCLTFGQLVRQVLGYGYANADAFLESQRSERLNNNNTPNC